MGCPCVDISLTVTACWNQYSCGCHLWHSLYLLDKIFPYELFLTWMMWFEQYITQAVWEYKVCKFKFVLKHRAHMLLTWWVCIEWSVWQVSQRSCPLRGDSCCCCWSFPPLHLFFCFPAAYTCQAKVYPSICRSVFLYASLFILRFWHLISLFK